MCFLTGCSGQTKQQSTLTTAEANTAEFGLSQAKTTLPEATSLAKAPANFFQALLTGDRNTIMSSLAPEISTITSQYDTGRKTAEEFAPRGGGRAAAIEELPFKQANQIEQLVQGARTTGATGVTSIAQLLGSLGLGEMGAGTSAANSAFGNIQTAKNDQNTQNAQAGQAIGTLVALLVGL